MKGLNLTDSIGPTATKESWPLSGQPDFGEERLAPEGRRPHRSLHSGTHEPLPRFDEVILGIVGVESVMPDKELFATGVKGLDASGMKPAIICC